MLHQLRTILGSIFIALGEELRRPKVDPLNGFPTEDEAYRGVLK